MSKPNRFYSKKQEIKVAKALNMKRTPNSGATTFLKGDVVGDEILIECKTLTRAQKQRTIRKEWLDKNKEEAFATGKRLSALAFDFGDGENYYILNEADFITLLESYREVNRE